MSVRLQFRSTGGHLSCPMKPKRYFSPSASSFLLSIPTLRFIIIYLSCHSETNSNFAPIVFLYLSSFLPLSPFLWLHLFHGLAELIQRSPVAQCSFTLICKLNNHKHRYNLHLFSAVLSVPIFERMLHLLSHRVFLLSILLVIQQSH